MAELDTVSMKKLIPKMHSISPTAHVGKGGVTEGVVNEIKNQLRKNELVKVKLLRSALAGMEKKALAEKLAEMTGALLVGRTGFIAVLYKKKEDAQYNKKEDRQHKKKDSARKRR